MAVVHQDNILPMEDVTENSDYVDYYEEESASEASHDDASQMESSIKQRQQFQTSHNIEVVDESENFDDTEFSESNAFWEEVSEEDLTNEDEAFEEEKEAEVENDFCEETEMPNETTTPLNQTAGTQIHDDDDDDDQQSFEEESWVSEAASSQDCDWEGSSSADCEFDLGSFQDEEGIHSSDEEDLAEVNYREECQRMIAVVHPNLDPEQMIHGCDLKNLYRNLKIQYNYLLKKNANGSEIERKETDCREEEIVEIENEDGNEEYDEESFQSEKIADDNQMNAMNSPTMVNDYIEEDTREKVAKLKVEKWLERDADDPEDYEYACRQLSLIMYGENNPDHDIETMLRRSSHVDLYRYLKQNYWYLVHTSQLGKDTITQNEADDELEEEPIEEDDNTDHQPVANTVKNLSSMFAAKIEKAEELRRRSSHSRKNELPKTEEIECNPADDATEEQDESIVDLHSSSSVAEDRLPSDEAGHQISLESYVRRNESSEMYGSFQIGGSQDFSCYNDSAVSFLSSKVGNSVHIGDETDEESFSKDLISNHEKEYKEIDCDENNESDFDEVQWYCSQLLARKEAGEELTENEIADLKEYFDRERFDAMSHSEDVTVSETEYSTVKNTGSTIHVVASDCEEGSNFPSPHHTELQKSAVNVDIGGESMSLSELINPYTNGLSGDYHATGNVSVDESSQKHNSLSSINELKTSNREYRKSNSLALCQEMTFDSLSFSNADVECKKKDEISCVSEEASLNSSLFPGGDDTFFRSFSQLQSMGSLGLTQTATQRPKTPVRDPKELQWRKDKIVADLKSIIEDAEQRELKQKIPEDIVRALNVGSLKTALIKKYYDSIKQDHTYYPSVAKAIYNFSAIEEAEKYQGTELPFEVATALCAIAASQLRGNVDEVDEDDKYVMKATVNVVLEEEIENESSSKCTSANDGDTEELSESKQHQGLSDSLTMHEDENDESKETVSNGLSIDQEIKLKEMSEIMAFKRRVDKLKIVDDTNALRERKEKDVVIASEEAKKLEEEHRVAMAELTEQVSLLQEKHLDDHRRLDKALVELESELLSELELLEKDTSVCDLEYHAEADFFDEKKNKIEQEFLAEEKRLEERTKILLQKLSVAVGALDLERSSSSITVDTADEGKKRGWLRGIGKRKTSEGEKERKKRMVESELKEIALGQDIEKIKSELDAIKAEARAKREKRAEREHEIDDEYRSLDQDRRNQKMEQARASYEREKQRLLEEKDKLDRTKLEDDKWFMSAKENLIRKYKVSQEQLIRANAHREEIEKEEEDRLNKNLLALKEKWIKDEAIFLRERDAIWQKSELCNPPNKTIGGGDNEVVPEHLAQMNQPKQQLDDSDHSLTTNELFDQPISKSASGKTLLSAVLKGKPRYGDTLAKDDNDRALSTHIHLTKLNQPKDALDETDQPLKMSEISEPTRRNLAPRKKGLLGATLKSENMMLQQPDTKLNGVNEDDRPVPAHLAQLNQPKEDVDEIDHSLKVYEIFEPKATLAPGKKLLAAALKGKSEVVPKQDIELKEANEDSRSTHDHLEHLNQPKEDIDETDHSLKVYEIFEPKATLAPGKKLLAAALKGKSEVVPKQDIELKEANKDSRSTHDHLEHLNQPKEDIDETDHSLKMYEIFEPKTALAPGKKTFLAAALKTKSEVEPKEDIELKEAHEDNRPNHDHLEHLNQPKENIDETDHSLKVYEIFESKTTLAPGKKVLAAALKGKSEVEQKEDVELKVAHEDNRPNHDHLEHLNQPNQGVENEKSLNLGDVFDQPKGKMILEKPLLSAALKGKQTRRETDTVKQEGPRNLSPAKDVKMNEIRRNEMSPSKALMEKRRRVEEARERAMAIRNGDSHATNCRYASNGDVDLLRSERDTVSMKHQQIAPRNSPFRSAPSASKEENMSLKTAQSKDSSTDGSAFSDMSTQRESSTYLYSSQPVHPMYPMIRETDRLVGFIRRYEKKLEKVCKSLLTLASVSGEDKKILDARDLDLPEMLEFIVEEDWYKAHSSRKRAEDLPRLMIPRSKSGGSDGTGRVQRYVITSTGKQFLRLGGSPHSDVFRFLICLDDARNGLSRDAMEANWKENWNRFGNEQSHRILEKLGDLISFCLESRMIKLE